MFLRTKKYGIEFQFDQEYLEVVERYSWSIDHNGYPAARAGGRVYRLHLLLFGKASQGFEWDHYNGDKLDNRRQNLRQVTHDINIRNRKELQINNTTGVTGVTINGNGYGVRINLKGKTYWLGTFPTLEEAKAARKYAEEKLWK